MSSHTTDPVVHAKPSFSSSQLCTNILIIMPSVLWRCWLGVRKGIRPGKNLSDEVLAWLSVWSEMQMTCIWFSWCHCHPIISASENPEWFVLLVPAYPGSPGKKAIKRLCVCVCVLFIHVKQLTFTLRRNQQTTLCIRSICFLASAYIVSTDIHWCSILV